VKSVSLIASAQRAAIAISIPASRSGRCYLLSSGGSGFLVLGGVFLCVTGAEALYADMGHFGAGPIRLAWSAVVFPSLVLNYAGQAALVLEGAPSSDNIFYRLCPSFLLLPLIVLATIATIIASQSIVWKAKGEDILRKINAARRTLALAAGPGSSNPILETEH
jgi:K+ transporter